MATTTDLNPTIARALEAFNDQDVDGFVAEFAENGTFFDPLQDSELTKSELRDYTADVFEAFPDVHAEEERIVTTEDTTAIEWTIHGTHEGQFGDIPPTGETVALPGVSLIAVSEDGIRSWRDYFDQQTFTEQLGLTSE